MLRKGAAACFVRNVKGKVSVLPEGSNTTIYHFTEDKNVELARDMTSITNLVTRVKVVGKEDKEGKQAVEAIVDGQTQYGIRQQIYVRSEDNTLATAKAAAQKILNTNGKPDRIMSVNAPDVPMIRKGDKVHIQAGTLNGYYIVKAIQHNASNRTMSMDLKEPESTNT